MLKIIKELEAAGSWNKMRKELTKLLGMEEMISSAVLRRAREDDKFASYLMMSRHSLDTLSLFLNSPKNAAYEISLEEIKHTNVDLAKRATKAIFNWGKSGFKKVDEAVFDARFSACEQCEYLKDAPDKLAYQVTLSRKSSNKICGACGCTASKKAWLATESCPVADPIKEGYNLWGEAIKKLEKVTASAK
ncbi:MAG: hypothetical protein AB8G15_11370 [Saprospiraceae bacterium]